MPKIFLLSKEELFTNPLYEFLKSKGTDVVLSENPHDLGGNISHLVVVNLDGKFSENQTLLKYLAKSATGLKVVVVNSAPGLAYSVTPVKQIFIDNILGLYDKPLRELYTKALKPEVYLPTKAWLSVCSLEEVLDKVAEELFSFSESKSFLFGKLISFQEAVGLLNPVAQVYADLNLPHRLPKPGLAVVETRLVPERILAFVSSPAKTKASKPRRKINKRPIVAAMATLVLLLFSPYILLATSGISAGVAYKAMSGGNLETAGPAMALTQKLSRASYRILSLLRFLPLTETAALVAKGAGIGGRVLAVSDYASQFSTQVSEGADVSGSTNGLYLELSALYEDLSFLNGEELPWIDFDIGKYREYALAASKLVIELPDILGYERPKTYMLLLQNNMELRPTGGFIGSFALLTFSKGELIDNAVYDVYSADGQLKGYITPPAPIEEHLGEASWTLRDSNWDPDFPTSASRAEWFLDKSLEREVDGVVAVNLEVARKYLEVLGPLSLPDFDDTIDSKNMYEKVQFEVEDNFFPGSRKKAHYLSALLDGIVARIENAGKAEILELLLATMSKLESRDIQIFLHDSESARVFSKQNWDGSIQVDPCASSNCESALFGIVEANLGVNKANYYISRSVRLSTQVGESELKHELVLTLKNAAPGRERIPEQRYKAYVRAIAEPNAKFREAYELNNSSRSYFDVDIEEFDNRVEYGLLVEVLPGETKSVVYNWSTPAKLNFKEDGELMLTWWKQSGTGDYPLELLTKLPEVPWLKSNPPMSLTEGGGYIYNTNLNRDLRSIFSWKPK